MDRLKIGLLTDMCGPVFGGGYQGTLWEVARRLARRHEVRVFTSLAEGTVQREGVSFVRAFPVGIYPDLSGTRGPVQPALLAPMCWRDPLDGWEPDALVVEAMPLTHLPVIARWVRRHPCVKLLNVDEAWVGYAPFRGPLSTSSLRLARWLLSRGLRWADTALAVSPATETALREAYGAPDVLAFPSGIDVPRLRGLLPRPGGTREIDVISVGRLVPIKRQRELIAALGQMRSKGRWAGRAVIVGEGPERDPLIGQVRHLGLEGHVELVGRVPESEKMSLLGRSRIFVLSSEREGFSLATLEAMLAGCLPVAAVPPHPEVFGAGGLVEEGRTGRRYPMGDVPRLAATLLQVLADPAGSARMAEVARGEVDRYDWDRLVARFEPELQRRVGESRRPVTGGPAAVNPAAGGARPAPRRR